MAFDSQAHRFADIVTSIKTKVVTVMGLDPSQFRIVANDRYDLYSPTVGDFVVLLRCYGPEPDTDAGVGRRARLKKRLLRFYLYYRNSLDQAGDDTTALTATNGVFDLEDLLVDALDDWFPDSNGTILTVEPLHPINSAEGPPTRKEDDDQGWVSSHIDMECKYVSLNRTPAP